jgi:hypothetical protein
MRRFRPRTSTIWSVPISCSGPSLTPSPQRTRKATSRADRRAIVLIVRHRRPNPRACDACIYSVLLHCWRKHVSGPQCVTRDYRGLLRVGPAHDWSGHAAYQWSAHDARRELVRVSQEISRYVASMMPKKPRKLRSYEIYVLRWRRRLPKGSRGADLVGITSRRRRQP